MGTVLFHDTHKDISCARAQPIMTSIFICLALYTSLFSFCGHRKECRFGWCIVIGKKSASVSDLNFTYIGRREKGG